MIILTNCKNEFPPQKQRNRKLPSLENENNYISNGLWIWFVWFRNLQLFTCFSFHFLICFLCRLSFSGLLYSFFFFTGKVRFLDRIGPTKPLLQSGWLCRIFSGKINCWWSSEVVRNTCIKPFTHYFQKINDQNQAWKIFKCFTERNACRKTF